MENLNEIEKYAEEIAGQWNGDESGWQEDRATCAGEILEYIKGIRECLKELNG